MTKKYILKPGKHQFAPGSHAVHDNESLSDKEAEWYLSKYPHIATLFEGKPGNKAFEIKAKTLNTVESAQLNQPLANSQINEDLSTTN